MTRFIEGWVQHLRCDACHLQAPHFTFSGDTDMGTIDLVSMSSIRASLLVIATVVDGEVLAAGYDDSAIAGRLNAALCRDDLRHIRFLRTEGGRVPGAASFQAFRAEYIPAHVIYECPACEAGEMRTGDGMSPAEFLAAGGKIICLDGLAMR